MSDKPRTRPRKGGSVTVEPPKEKKKPKDDGGGDR